MKTSQRIRRLTALMLAAALLLTSCGGGGKATTMHLKRTEGRVNVSDDGGKDLEPRDDLGLYSGYEVETKRESYAWIDLDEVKLAKLDEKTEIEIDKDGKDLEIIVNEGSLFFNVTEPLADDETMTIRSSTMSVGIRGTCGWVVSMGDQGSQVFILEGTVEAEALDTGETVSVSAGEMAEVAVNGDGKMEITVQPFSEEYIAPFVLTELEDDEELSAAVLEASGLDALNPPDPAERLRADYQAIIADRPIFDNGAAEGVSYTADGITYASEGLGDAVLVDLNGDGLDELLLLTRKAEGIQWEGDFVGVCTQMEIYGSVMGRAALYDSMTFNESDYPSRLPRVYHMLHMPSGDGHPCIYMYGGYQSVEDERLWALENNKLTLVESGYFNEYGHLDRTGFVEFTEEEYTVLELPKLPEDSRRKTAYLYALSEEYILYADLTDLNQDGVDEMIVLEQYLGEDYFCFNVLSWDGAGIQNTEYETDIVYAKFIDMNQDGREELLLIGENDEGEIEFRPNVVVYSWDKSGIHKTNLEFWHWGGYMGDPQEGLFRDRTTRDVYVGSRWWGGAGTFWEFASLTDSVSLEWNNPFYEVDPGKLTQEEADALLEETDREHAASDAQLERFELIEEIHIFLEPHSSNYSYEWQNAFGNTVDQVQQQLMAR